MATSVDTAKDLLTFAGGPSMVGTLALLGFAKKVLDDDERRPGKGWTALGAGFALAVWLVVFVIWAAPTVFRSWSADGDPNVSLVLLSITWFIAIVLLLLVGASSPKAARYLSEAYRADEGPWSVRLIRKILR